MVDYSTRLKRINELRKDPSTPWGMFWFIFIIFLILSVVLALRDTGTYYRSLSDEQRALVAPVAGFIGQVSSVVWALDYLQKHIPFFTTITNIFYYGALFFLAFLLSAVAINLLLDVIPWFPPRKFNGARVIPQTIKKFPEGTSIIDKYTYLYFYRFYYAIERSLKVQIWTSFAFGLISVVPILNILTIGLPGLISWVASKFAVSFIVGIFLLVICILFVFESLEVKGAGAFFKRLGVFAAIFVGFALFNNWVVKLSVVYSTLWKDILSYISTYFVFVSVLFAILFIVWIIPIIIYSLLKLIFFYVGLRQIAKEAIGESAKKALERQFKEKLTTGISVAAGLGEAASGEKKT